jgi:DNA-binding MarR family transcriptional regulator
MLEDLPDLGELERRVMHLVWSRGPITADAARIALRRRLKDSTIRTVLRRLEEKGYVRHTVDARTYIYAATEPRGEVALLARRPLRSADEETAWDQTRDDKERCAAPTNLLGPTRLETSRVSVPWLCAVLRERGIPALYRLE